MRDERFRRLMRVLPGRHTATHTIVGDAYSQHIRAFSLIGELHARTGKGSEERRKSLASASPNDNEATRSKDTYILISRTLHRMHLRVKECIAVASEGMSALRKRVSIVSGILGRSILTGHVHVPGPTYHVLQRRLCNTRYIAANDVPC